MSLPDGCGTAGHRRAPSGASGAAHADVDPGHDTGPEVLVEAPQHLPLAVAPLGGPGRLGDPAPPAPRRRARPARRGRRGACRRARPSARTGHRGRRPAGRPGGEQAVERRADGGGVARRGRGAALVTGSAGRQLPPLTAGPGRPGATDERTPPPGRSVAVTCSTCSGRAPGGMPLAEVSSAWPGGRSASSRASHRRGSSSEKMSSSSSTGGDPHRLGDHLVGGEAQRDRQRPLLALAGVRCAPGGRRWSRASSSRWGPTVDDAAAQVVGAGRGQRVGEAALAAVPGGVVGEPDLGAGVGADRHGGVGARTAGARRSTRATRSRASSSPAAPSLASNTSRVSSADSSRRPRTCFSSALRWRSTRSTSVRTAS